MDLETVIEMSLKVCQAYVLHENVCDINSSSSSTSCGKKMPGLHLSYCCMPHCSSSSKNMDLCNVPTGHRRGCGALIKDWAEKFHQVLFKYRDDQEFKKRLFAGKLLICQKHFASCDIQLTKRQSWLKVGAIPTHSLPEKYCSFGQAAEEGTVLKHSSCHNLFTVPELVNQFKLLKKSGWHMYQVNKTQVHFTFCDNSFFHVSTISLLVSEESTGTLTYSCAYRGYYVPFVANQLAVQCKSLKDIFTFLQKYRNCEGYHSVIDKLGWRCIPNPITCQLTDTRYISEKCKYVVHGKNNVCQECKKLCTAQTKSKKQELLKTTYIDLSADTHAFTSNSSKKHLQASALEHYSRDGPCEDEISNEGSFNNETTKEPPKLLEQSAASAYQRLFALRKYRRGKCSTGKVWFSSLKTVTAIKYCNVPMCCNNTKQHPHLNFHPISNTESRRSLRGLPLVWRKFLRATYMLWGFREVSEFGHQTYICSAHFKDQMFLLPPGKDVLGCDVKLKIDAFPSVDPMLDGILSTIEKQNNSKRTLDEITSSESRAPVADNDIHPPVKLRKLSGEDHFVAKSAPSTENASGPESSPSPTASCKVNAMLIVKVGADNVSIPLPPTRQSCLQRSTSRKSSSGASTSYALRCSENEKNCTSVDDELPRVAPAALQDDTVDIKPVILVTPCLSR